MIITGIYLIIVFLIILILWFLISIKKIMKNNTNDLEKLSDERKEYYKNMGKNDKRN